MNFYDDLIVILNLNSTFITFQFTAISNKLSSTDEFILKCIRFIFFIFMYKLLVAFQDFFNQIS